MKPKLPVRETWGRLAALLVCYLLIPLLWRLSTPETGIVSAITTLFLIFPAIVLALSAWDGAKRGFGILWIICPFLFWLLPTFIYMNDSALAWGVFYTGLAVLSNSTAAFLTRDTRDTRDTPAAADSR